jgi:TonB family protein
MTAANAVAWFAQVAVIVGACAGLPRLVGLRSATMQHLFWRLVLAVCLALPIVQPRLPHEMAFVPAPATPAGPALVPPSARAVAPVAPPVNWVGLAVIMGATGMALRLAWIAAGLLRLRRLRHGAVEAAEGFDDLRQTIGVCPVAIAWSPDTPHPITFGAIDPVVLLPITLKSADAKAPSTRRHLFHRVMLLSKEGTMSSTRIAVASCLLAVMLAGGAWKAVHAFPLYGGGAGQQVPPPQPPDRPDTLIPQTREAYHVVATLNYEIAQRDTSLTPEQRLAMIVRGIAAEDRALAIDPNYVPALVDKNVLLRLQADLTSDPSARDRLIAEADELRQTAIVLQGSAKRTPPSDGWMPPPPPPPPPPSQSANGEVMIFVPKLDDLHGTTTNPVRIGGDVPAPVKIRDVRPVYPPIAQQAGVQGTVVVEVLIDSAGYVAQGHILRSIPLLDQAALDAVQQWKFVPVMVNGVARPATMTLTVNFTLKQ